MNMDNELDPRIIWILLDMLDKLQDYDEDLIF